MHVLRKMFGVRKTLRANLARARFAFQTGDWEEAIRSYRLVLREDPKRWQDAVQLGHALKESGRHEQALKVYLRVQAAEPRDVDIHVQLGHLYTVMEDSETACRWYQRALALAGESSEISGFLGNARISCVGQSHGEARTPVDWRSERLAAVEAEIAGGSAAKAGHAAQICVQLGRLDLADAHLARYRDWAKSAGPQDRYDAARQTADFCWKVGRWTDALTHYLEAETHLNGTTDARGAIGLRIDDCVRRMYPALSAQAVVHG